VFGHDANPDEGLVSVAFAENSLEGQMIAGLLESEGIGCLQFLGTRGSQVARVAAMGERGDGPRRVMVRAADVERATELLERTGAEVDEFEAPEAPDLG
jgi:hypothetical protein